MNPDNLLLALIGAIGAGIPTWLLARRTPRRMVTEEGAAADAAGDISTAAATMVGLATSEVKRLNEEIRAARTEAHEAKLQAENCTRRIARFADALRAAGIDPEGIPA